jgi:hypothetical protein
MALIGRRCFFPQDFRVLLTNAQVNKPRNPGQDRNMAAAVFHAIIVSNAIFGARGDV